MIKSGFSNADVAKALFHREKCNFFDRWKFFLGSYGYLYRVLSKTYAPSGKKFQLIFTCSTEFFFFSSIMHYTDDAWTGNKNLKSIETKDPSKQHLLKRGTRKPGLSKLDIKQINLLYKCDGVY